MSKELSFLLLCFQLFVLRQQIDWSSVISNRNHMISVGRWMWLKSIFKIIYNIRQIWSNLNENLSPKVSLACLKSHDFHGRTEVAHWWMLQIPLTLSHRFVVLIWGILAKLFHKHTGNKWDHPPQNLLSTWSVWFQLYFKQREAYKEKPLFVNTPLIWSTRDSECKCIFFVLLLV